jgi:uncharacterized protein (TIGR01777 family)
MFSFWSEHVRGDFIMKILVSGSSGFVGTALLESLRNDGHTVARLLRSNREVPPGDVSWDPVAGTLDLAAAEGADALVNLAGANIGEKRWTTARKAELRSSRVNATSSLVDAIAKLRNPPKVFVSASAIGYYGSRGNEPLTEANGPGNGFLADLSAKWEASASRAQSRGIRTVMPRFGIILAAHGGALPRMLLPFKLGLGGRLGSGRQWMSWVTLDEVTCIIRYLITRTDVQGPVNVVAPNPVQNSEFTRTLARVLHRPRIFPAPEFALRLVLGEMADGLLLASQRVLPAKLADAGYEFRDPELASALTQVLRKTN